MMKFFLTLFSVFILQGLPVYSEDYNSKLNAYLAKQGVVITEGYCTGKQLDQFSDRLLIVKNDIKNILEIGLNAGHSADFFLMDCPNASLYSFDINWHSYTKVGLKYLNLTYPGRVTFIEGNSLSTIPEFGNKNPSLKFDLIYVDGDHSYGGCLNDILNCRKLADKNTILIIDDYNIDTVARAINECAANGYIKIISDNKSFVPPIHAREWVEARYLILN